MGTRCKDVTAISNFGNAGLEKTGPAGSWVRGEFWYLRETLDVAAAVSKMAKGPQQKVADDAVYMVPRIALAFWLATGPVLPSLRAFSGRAGHSARI
jgi:hypothetical protein